MPDGSAVVRQAPPSLAVAAVGWPKRHPRAASLLLVWLLGLYCAFLATPPPVSEAQTRAFKLKVKEAEGMMPELTQAERVLMEAELSQRQHKVWFWRLKAEARQQVAALQPAVDAAKARVRGVEARRDRALREAKAALGLWSDASVQEGRELFWDSFAAGKVFAQRQSFFDAFFRILDSRGDRDWMSLLLQLLFQTFVNFFTGLTASVFVFMVQLPSLIWSFQPSLWSGVAFFALASIAAISVVAGYLGALAGAGAVATYTTLQLAMQQAGRVEAAHQQRQRLDYGRRAHHD